MNKLLTSIVMSGAFLATTIVPAYAGKIANRKENQQDRITQGVKSGQLTAGETARIERKESALNQEVRAERTLNNGKLTPAEKKQVNQQQNRLSRQIYNQKHDAQKQ